MDTTTPDFYIGSRLRLMREEKNLTLDEVACQLRLKKDLIDDIEQGNYSQIPVPYLKGYLRSYAKLLSLSEVDFLTAINPAQIDGSMSGWKIFSSHKQISSSDRSIQWITYSIISALVLLVILWWKSDNLLYKNLSINEVMPDQGIYTMANNNNLDTK